MTISNTMGGEQSLDAAKPKPFLKWVGGKRKLSDRIIAAGPKSFDRYCEPFLGGGAVFFELRARGYDGPAQLSDVNQALVLTYKAVRDNPRAVIKELRNHINTEAHFYEVRASWNDDGMLAPGHIIAARMIYLNKTCFNGLWRVNSKGGMNSPFGRYDDPNFCDEETILAASKALKGTVIKFQPFNAGDEDESKAGDFIYCDPPYVPASHTANFTAYDKSGFDGTEQIKLRDRALDWRRYGAHVVLSNADVPAVRELYSRGFDIETAQRSGNVSCKGAARGKVGELIMVAR